LQLQLILSSALTLLNQSFFVPLFAFFWGEDEEKNSRNNQLSFIPF
jgi:hypothetical protein